MWCKVLTQHLSNYPNQTITGPRPVWICRQRDKMSTAWLLCLPGANGLSSAQFSEAMSLFLCASSTASISRLREKIGKSQVDLYGDRLCTESGLTGRWSQEMPQKIKSEINNKCIWAGLDAECEPYSLFRHLIPQKPSTELTKEEQGRF